MPNPDKILDSIGEKEGKNYPNGGALMISKPDMTIRYSTVNFTEGKLRLSKRGREILTHHSYQLQA